MRKAAMKGNIVTLAGKEIEVGEKAPDFTVIGKDMNSIRLSDFAGKTVVINAVPSIDTPVCDMQVRRFNKDAAELPGVVILSVSVDLPFALDRYCAAMGIDAVITASDHKDLDFGTKYGLVIEEMRILSRAVIVIDKNGIVRYAEYLKEISNAPDFDKAMLAIKECC